jgi:hypothetical protein
MGTKGSKLHAFQSEHIFSFHHLRFTPYPQQLRTATDSIGTRSESRGVGLRDSEGRWVCCGFSETCQQRNHRQGF